MKNIFIFNFTNYNHFIKYDWTPIPRLKTLATRLRTSRLARPPSGYARIPSIRARDSNGRAWVPCSQPKSLTNLLWFPEADLGPRCDRMTSQYNGNKVILTWKSTCVFTLSKFYPYHMLNLDQVGQIFRTSPRGHLYVYPHHTLASSNSHVNKT